MPTCGRIPKLISLRDLYILANLILSKIPMKLLKKILFVFIIIGLSTALAIWMLTKNFTHTAVKDLINKELSAITSQKSRIEGEVMWRLFPRPGVKITQIHLVDGDEKANCSLFIEDLLFNLQISPLLRGQLVFKEIKIDGLTANIKNPQAQTNACFGKMSAPASIQNNFGPLRFAIDRFLLKRGQIVITQPKQKITLTNLQLEAEQLNLKKRFLPLQFKTTLAISTAQNKTKASLTYNGRIRLAPTMLTQPEMMLQNTGINGQLLVQNLRFNQFKISKLSASARTKKGTLTLNPLNMLIYTGESVGDLSYEFATKKLSINQTATKLDSTQFFKTIFGKALVKGHLDISAHGSMNLQDDNWQDNLTGNGHLSIKDGVIYFVDFQALTDNASKKIHSLSTQQNQTNMNLALEQPLISPKANPVGSTPFQLLSLQYQLEHGKFIGDSLLLQTNNLELKGHGQINLNNYALSGNLSATLVTADSMVGKIQQLLGGSFPLLLAGTILQPEIVPNEREISPIVTRYVLKNVLVFPVKTIKTQLQNIILTPALLLAN